MAPVEWTLSDMTQNPPFTQAPCSPPNPTVPVLKVTGLPVPWPSDFWLKHPGWIGMLISLSTVEHALLTLQLKTTPLILLITMSAWKRSTKHSKSREQSPAFSRKLIPLKSLACHILLQPLLHPAHQLTITTSWIEQWSAFHLPQSLLWMLSMLSSWLMPHNM